MATVTVADRVQLLLKLGSRRANPALRYDLSSADTHAAEIVRIFDDILIWSSENVESTGYRMTDAKRIGQNLETAAAWNVVHRGYAQPFLRDVCEVAIIQKLNQTLSAEIGVLLLVGLRDSRFLGIPNLGSLYCEQVLYVAKRRSPPPMNEVIRLLETLSIEPRPLGSATEAPWRSTLQRLAKTYEVQLPIPAEAPETQPLSLPIPADESDLDSEPLPKPAAPPVSKPVRKWWRR